MVLITRGVLSNEMDPVSLEDCPHRLLLLLLAMLLLLLLMPLPLLLLLLLLIPLPLLMLLLRPLKPPPLYLPPDGMGLFNGVLK